MTKKSRQNLPTKKKRSLDREQKRGFSQKHKDTVLNRGSELLGITNNI